MTGCHTAWHPEEVTDPMTDVLTAYEELRQAEVAAARLVEQARLNFGRAIHEARNLPAARRVEQQAIADKVGLKRERVRQIERLYEDSVSAS
jgi:vacuolar-type H+-ATPase subunit H